jgi:hypothetical protein
MLVVHRADVLVALRSILHLIKELRHCQPYLLWTMTHIQMTHTQREKVL